MKNILINPRKVKKIDLIVGIPSFNEADNIGFVAEMVDKGLRKYYPQQRAVIINLDNDSSDGTREAFLTTETETPKIYLSTPKGVRGKGHNFLNLFSQVKKLKPKAVTVVDADLKSIRPDWIKAFFNPVLKKHYDYVTPHYARNEYDGTITNHISYPLILGLYGVEIRQPIGGDFAFSPRLVTHWLKKKWRKAARQYGVDTLMTLGAITGGYRICQVRLGAKIHKPSLPKLGPMFSQVVLTSLREISQAKKHCFKIKKRRPIPLYGAKKRGRPPSLAIDYKGMRSTALFEYQTYGDTLKRVLTPEVYEKIDKMFQAQRITIDRVLWAKILYDMIYAYEQTGSRRGLVESLRPLYFGRIVSFIKKTMDFSHERSEKEILAQARTFWRLRGYLLDKYR